MWIQGAYNPILDQNGRPFKVVKFATDVTDQVKLPREPPDALETGHRERHDPGECGQELTSVSQQMAPTPKKRRRRPTSPPRPPSR